jgi:PAS domain S-box-containing protein
MPDLLKLDITALGLSIVLSSALILTVGGAGMRKPLNRWFILFSVMETAWAVFSMLLRLSLWFRAGDSQALLELATLAFGLMGPLLLLFTARYVGLEHPWPSWAAIVAIVVAAALTAPLFQGRLISSPVLDPNGSTLYSISAVGIAASVAPGVCLALSLLLFWLRRASVKEPFLIVSVLVTFAGFVVGGLFRLRVPILSITNTVSVGILGWGIARRQLFNPLRESSAGLQERADRLELIWQVGRKTTALLELDELLLQAGVLIRDTFSYYSVGILLVEGKELVLRASTLPAIQARGRKLRLTLGRGITGTVAATGQALLVPDVRKDPRYVMLAKEVETRSELAVPILRGGTVIGVLDVQSERVSAFTPADLATQQTVADQLSAAIENARLYGEVRRRAERLSLINRISAAVGAVLNLPDLLETVHREVVPFFEADAFFIALYDPAANELDFRIQVDEGVREPSTREPVGRGLTSRLIRDRKPLLVNDVAHPPDDLPTPEPWGTGKMPSSWLGVPILISERLIGVMSVQTYSPHLYAEEDVLLAATIADQVAVAIENARLYEEVRRDLADRGRAEKVLRESEEKFRNLAEQTPNMIHIWSGGKIVYANRQCEITMGYTRDEFYDPAFSFLDVTAPEHRALMAENHARHLRGEEVPPNECAVTTRGGRRLEVLMTTKLISYGGDPAILSIATDITAQKRIERLLESLNAAALAMEQALSPVEIFPIAVRQLAGMGILSAVFLLDESKERLALRWYGSREGGAVAVEEGSPIGSRWIDAAEVPSLAEALASRRTVLTTLDRAQIAALRERGVVNLRGAQDDTEPLRAILAPLIVADDSFGVLVASGDGLGEEARGVFTAFANQAAAAWRKTKLMQDLEESLAQLKKAQEQLLHAQKMEAIGRLAGGIAHDFNNLLTVISGYTNLLTDSLEGNAPALVDLGEIRNAIRRASALTGRLLAFSRKQVLQPAVLDMNKVISSSVNLLRPLIGEDIELAVRLCPQAVCVRADPFQVEQVIVNLAVNARDAMPDGGTLTIGAESAEISEALDGIPPGPYVVLTVADTGSGMSDDTKGHLFEPFFTTKENGRGTGLGLSTVYGIVTQTGGRIRVTSSLGTGSSFAAYFPRVQPGTERACPEVTPAAPGVGSGVVLVVEDEQTVRELSRRVLEQGGYSVLVASSPREAVRVAESAPRIDLLLTDVVMPGGMNGVELGVQLQRDRPDLKVLHMSGYTNEEAIRLGVTTRRMNFLAKPFQPGQLLRRVGELLRGQALV